MPDVLFGVSVSPTEEKSLQDRNSAPSVFGKGFYIVILLSAPNLTGGKESGKS